MDAHSGADPFIMLLDGEARSSPQARSKTRRCPAHYEPLQSVVRNELYTQQSNPVLGEYDRDDNPYNGPINDRVSVRAHDLSRHRDVGHHDALRAVASRTAAAAFCEIDPELAVSKGIKNGDWVYRLDRASVEIEVRALV